MKPDTDVVVVGARVAGSMTALHLARRGYRVLIVDRAGPPGDTLSTHAIMRSGVLQLRRAGLLDTVVDANTPPITTLGLGFGSGEPIRIGLRREHGVDALYAPRRTVLDPIVLAAAAEAGAEVALGESVTGLIRDERSRVSGVAVGRGPHSRVIRTRYVVGADGRHSSVASMVAAGTSRSIPATSASVYSYFAGIDPEAGFDVRFVDQASAGLFATNDGLSLLYVSLPHAQLGDADRTFEATLRRVAPDLADAAAEGERVERFRRAQGIDSFLRDPAGPGWVLVGDAGFTKDPISAHGISCALRDAELAAYAVDAALVDRHREAAAGAAYRAARDRFALPLLRYTTALAAHDWTPDEASSLMRALGRVTDDECDFLSRRPVEDRAVA